MFNFCTTENSQRGRDIWRKVLDYAIVCKRGRMDEEYGWRPFIANCPAVFLSFFSLWICFEEQLTNTKIKMSKTSWLSRAVTSTSMSVVRSWLGSSLLLVESWSASARWTAAGAGAPLRIWFASHLGDLGNGLRLEWLTKEMRIGKTRSKRDVRTVKKDIICWKKGQEGGWQ